LFTITAVFLTAAGLTALLFVWMSGGAQAAPNAVWYVDPAGNDANDCLSPATACATIQAAVDKAAGSGDTIEVAAGTYLENLTINKGVTLNGVGADSVIIDGNGAARVITHNNSSLLTISGITIQNGATASGNLFDRGGGAILNSGSLTLQDSVVRDNAATGNGGAILTLSGALVIENSQIISNTAQGDGGAIYGYLFAGTISVTNSLLANNTAVSYYGGAIYSSNGLYMNNTTVRDNSAPTIGGGLVVDGGATAVIENSLVTGNQAAIGAGISTLDGVITLTNVTVSNNTASNNYSGVYSSGSTTSLFTQNSTIVNNQRTNTGGTGYNGLIAASGAAVTMVNTIIANNDGRNCLTGSGATLNSQGYNLSSDFTCNLTQTGDQQGVNPLLGALVDNGGPTLTHALLAGSPAVDAGTNGNCPATDQRGVARPYDGDNDGTATCDVGAVEAQHRLTIADVSLVEGDTGTTNAVFMVTLTPDSNQTVTVDYATSDDTATAGSDYTAVANTLTFNPGVITQTIAVPIIGDTSDELDETFNVTLSNAVNAVILDGTAVGTIIDDDGLPLLTISDQTVLEGDFGTTNMVFDVTLSLASADTVTVDYATVNGAATGGADFTSVSGTLTFTPGQTSQQISVAVSGDLIDEGSSEAFTVQLTNPVNAAINDGAGSGTISDDDTAVLRQVIGPQVPEGDNGLTPAVFTVTLSTPASFVITVDYAASSGYNGAQEGVDFQPASGTLTFQPGETAQTYTVQIIGDMEVEEDELFSVTLSNGTVSISPNGTDGIILNDDNYKLYLPLILR